MGVILVRRVETQGFVDKAAGGSLEHSRKPDSEIDKGADRGLMKAGLLGTVDVDSGVPRGRRGHHASVTYTPLAAERNDYALFCKAVGAIYSVNVDPSKRAEMLASPN